MIWEDDVIYDHDGQKWRIIRGKEQQRRNLKPNATMGGDDGLYGYMLEESQSQLFTQFHLFSYFIQKIQTITSKVQSFYPLPSKRFHLFFSPSFRIPQTSLAVAADSPVVQERQLYSSSFYNICEMSSKLRAQTHSADEEDIQWSDQPAGQTVDFGIQVDLNQNPQAGEGALECEEDGLALEGKVTLSCEEKRKLKKKLNKKRRREKAAEMQREARRQIGNIIQEFYEGRAKFEDYRGKIEVLVELIYNNDFRDYLDQLIRMRVNYIQKAIWEYTQSILEDSHFQKSDDHAFYSQMVDKIFDTFLDIEDSSQEIEKIINIYLRFAYQKSESKEEIIYNNLAINTFNYMIETDETLKNLLHICDKKISPARVQTRKKLEELISIIDCYYDDYQDQLDESTNCPTDDLQSTGHSQQEEPQQRKKRRRKVKENDLLCEEQVLLKRLNSMLIREDERNPCRIDEQRLAEWKQRLRQRKE